MNAIQFINQINFTFTPSTRLLVSIGGFTWDLSFFWFPIPEHEKERLKSVVDYVRLVESCANVKLVGVIQWSKVSPGM